jgi:enoyl-CoA hydratase
MGFLQPMLQLSPRLLRNFKAQALAKRRGLGRDERREAEMRSFIEAWTHEDHWAAVERILAGERPGRTQD